MPLTNSLLNQLKKDFPQITFVQGDFFAWSPGDKAVFYTSEDPKADELILHEVSHHLLEHTDYPKDVALLNMETTAWDKARNLAKDYRVPLLEETIQDHLDTYREWLHSRSTCPECTATGYQTGAKEYSCPACNSRWKVNEARLCGLKRYKI